MRFRFLILYLLLAFCAVAAEYRPLATKNIAFLVSNDPNDQENAAKAMFQAAYPEGVVLSYADFDAEHLRNIATVWIHCDRVGLSQGVNNLAAYYGDDFLSTLTAYSKSGGNLYLTSQAVQLVAGMGRISSQYDINLYNANANNTPLSEAWSISGSISDAQHGDNNGHAIYGTPYDDFPGYFVPISGSHSVLGPTSGSIHVDDNNCIWQNFDLNAFRNATAGQVIGTWGQLSGYVNTFGIVEFLPSICDFSGTMPGQTRFPDAPNNDEWKGNIIANGLGCCQWAPEGENAYYTNLRDLTFNTLNYLTKEYEPETVADPYFTLETLKVNTLTAKNVTEQEPHPAFSDVAFWKAPSIEATMKWNKARTAFDGSVTCTLYDGNETVASLTLDDVHFDADADAQTLSFQFPQSVLVEPMKQYTYTFTRTASGSTESIPLLGVNSTDAYDLRTGYFTLDATDPADMAQDVKTWPVQIIADITLHAAEPWTGTLTCHIDGKEYDDHDIADVTFPEQLFANSEENRTVTLNCVDFHFYNCQLKSSCTYFHTISYAYLPTTPGPELVAPVRQTYADPMLIADPRSFSTGGILTGIDAPAVESSEQVWYDLQGRRLSEPLTPGLYIHNGNKVLVK